MIPCHIVVFWTLAWQDQTISRSYFWQETETIYYNYMTTLCTDSQCVLVPIAEEETTQMYRPRCSVYRGRSAALEEFKQYIGTIHLFQFHSDDVVMHGRCWHFLTFHRSERFTIYLVAFLWLLWCVWYYNIIPSVSMEFISFTALKYQPEIRRLHLWPPSLK